MHRSNTGIDVNSTELDLASQHVDIKAVSKMVKFKAQLQDLNLSGNVLGNHGAKDIAAMIAENSTIKRLKLKNCGIGSQGL